MVRIYDPAQLTHPTLREFAVMAAWISVVAQTVQELEERTIDLSPEERALPDLSTPWPWAFDPLRVAHVLVQMNRGEAASGLVELLAAWMGDDRENGPVWRLTLIDPWQEPAGIWSAQTPAWIRILAGCAATAPATYGSIKPHPTD